MHSHLRFDVVLNHPRCSVRADELAAACRRLELQLRRTPAPPVVQPSGGRRQSLAHGPVQPPSQQQQCDAAAVRRASGAVTGPSNASGRRAAAGDMPGKRPRFPRARHDSSRKKCVLGRGEGGCRATLLLPPTCLTLVHGAAPTDTWTSCLALAPGSSRRAWHSCWQRRQPQPHKPCQHACGATASTLVSWTTNVASTTAAVTVVVTSV